MGNALVAPLSGPFTPALRHSESPATTGMQQRYRNVLKKYGTLSHLWDFGVPQGPLNYAASYPNVFLSGELVANGGFDSDTWWTKTGSASISGGLGHLLGTSSLERGSFATANRAYNVTATVTIRSGTVRLQIGGDFLSVTSSGTYSVVLRPTATTLYLVGMAGVDADIDNVSVREVYASSAAEFLAAYPLWPLWQDTAGTVPACKINDPIGLCLDQPTGVVTLGPELVVNGDNETGVVTSLATANGSLVRDTTKYKTGTASAKFTANSATSVNHQFTVATIQSNKSIIVEYDYFVPTGSITLCRAFDSDDGSWFTNTANGSVKDQWVHVHEFRAAKASVWSLAIGNNVNQSIDGQSFWLDNISVREVIGAHASQTTPTKRAILDAAGSSVSDGIDDVLTTTTGGASSTAAFLCVAFNTSRSGSAQTLWSDRTGNAGLKLEITAANALVLSGGTGSAIVTATGGTVAASAPHIATVKYDGTTLSVQLDNGTVATAACALSTGTAAITVGMDNGAVTAPYKGVLRQCTYIKDSLPTTGEQLLIRQATAASIGVVL